MVVNPSTSSVSSFVISFFVYFLWPVIFLLGDKLVRTRPEILVCTPGRLIDIINSHMKNDDLNLSQVEYFILDEGDRMLDMGFQDDIVEI